jgi:uncharacterized protein (TIGR02453 family)
MEFSGFLPEALDFLVENRLHNDKGFYDAHKEQYIKQIKEPFYALAEKMVPVMEKMDPDFITDPKRILSRLRRDTRFTKDKSLYRDRVWLAFVRDKKRWSSSPCCYFEISPEGFAYGVGYYWMPPSQMAICRDMILHEDPIFRKAYRCVQKNTKFIFDGLEYKRPKCPDAPKKYQTWLNKKELQLSYDSEDFEQLFSGEFVDPMLKDLEIMIPFYCFLQEAEARGKNKLE